MAGQDHPFRAPEVGARDNRVTLPVNTEVSQGPKGRFDGIGNRTLVAGDAHDVDELGSEVGYVLGEVERSHPSTLRNIAPRVEGRGVEHGRASVGCWL